jgi:MFS family permease
VHPLVNRNFALLWAGQVISTLGDTLLDTTLVLWLATSGRAGRAGHAWAPLAVSGLLAAATLPVLLLRPLAGVLVDRWDKRRALLAMDVLRALLIALLLPLAARPGPPPAGWLAAVYVVVLLASVCAQVFNPALFVLITLVVSAAERPRAMGLNEVIFNLAVILGPPLAGSLFFGLGLGPALALDAASFLVSLATIWAVRVPALPPPASTNDAATERVVSAGVRHELAEGVHFVLGNPVVRTLALALSVAVFGAGMLQALQVFFVTDTLHAPPALYGLFAGAFGLGSITGALLVPRMAHRWGLTRTFALSMMAVGTLLVVFARMTSFAPALAIFLLLGVPNATSNVTLWSLVMRATPPSLLGRVNSMLVPAYTLASLVGIALAGALAGGALPHFAALGLTFGPVDMLLTAAGLLVALGGMAAVALLPRC